MNESLVEEVMEVRGVKGAALIRPMGEVAASNLGSQELTDFLGFLFAMVPLLKSPPDWGDLRGIVATSNSNDAFCIFLQDDEALGVVADQQVSIRALRDEIDELFLWG